MNTPPTSQQGSEYSEDQDEIIQEMFERLLAQIDSVIDRLEILEMIAKGKQPQKEQDLLSK